MELTVQQYLLELIHKGFRMTFRRNAGVMKNGQFPVHSENEGGHSDEQEKIKKHLLDNKPGMLVRFGSIELYAFINYLQVSGQMLDSAPYSAVRYIFDNCFPNWFSIGSRNGMLCNAGFFPSDADNLRRWGELVLNDLKEIDVLFTWQEAERYIRRYIPKRTEYILNSEMYWPYFFHNPWYRALEGKKVLIVSPFAETIKKQYKKRLQLFPGGGISLPEFEMKVIKAYNVLQGVNTYESISSWFDALDDMKCQMESIDYDVVLLGCGAYAFNLAAHAKRMGKKGMTVCGSLQTLFGIYGRRYEAEFRKRGIINENWVKPDADERPAGYKKVEKGAYW